MFPNTNALRSHLSESYSKSQEINLFYVPYQFLTLAIMLSLLYLWYLLSQVAKLRLISAP
nr:MAG TPA: hypothetical protein [Bacteriophage sp.]